MARYIDLDKIEENMIYENQVDLVDLNLLVEEDVAPVIHARWEEIITGDNLYVVTICSNCKGDAPIDDGISPIWKYCPYCGAKMDM